MMSGNKYFKYEAIFHHKNKSKIVGMYVRKLDAIQIFEVTNLSKKFCTAKYADTPENRLRIKNFSQQRKRTFKLRKEGLYLCDELGYESTDQELEDLIDQLHLPKPVIKTIGFPVGKTIAENNKKNYDENVKNLRAVYPAAITTILSRLGEINNFALIEEEDGQDCLYVVFPDGSTQEFNIWDELLAIYDNAA